MEKKYIKPINALKKKSGLKKFHNHVAYYSVVFDDGGEIRNVVNGHTECHSGLEHPRYIYNGEKLKPEAKAIAIMNALGELQVDDAVARRFLEWFLNYSPYHTVWATKSPRTAMKDGILVGNTNVPGNLVGGAMFATRSLWEHRARVAKIWDVFVKAGMHPDIAFLLGHTYVVNGGNISYSPINWHVPIDGYIEPNHVINFLTGNRNDIGNYDVVETYQRRVHWTWHKENDLAKGIVLKHDVWLDEVGKEKKKEKVNPFAKEVAAAVRIEAAAEHLTPIYRELFKEWI